MVLMRRLLLAGFLIGLLPIQSLAAEARLWIVSPDRLGDLSNCSKEAERAVALGSAAARLVASDALVRWADGWFLVHGEEGSKGDPGRVLDQCFLLEVDGRAIASGAVVSRYSARLLRFPALLIWSLGQRPLEFLLTPRYPDDTLGAIPPSWRDVLPSLR
ncbi:MAG: hypothetical protein H7841_05030 [Magnetospirillum sp. WYHS-4]